MAAKTHSALPNFNGKLTFDRIQLSNAKKNALSSKFVTSEDKIKI